MAKIHIIITDIIKLDVDAIVNSANTSLLAGSGLCGLIHKAAGRELEEECKSIGGCPTGQAVISDGYQLKAGNIIHAVGPHYFRDAENAPELLECCYRSILTLANAHELKSIAIPAISTGVYHYPILEATTIALNTIKTFLENENVFLSDIVLSLRTDEHYQVYKTVYGNVFTDMKF